MKFIHAVVFNVDEAKQISKENFNNWNELTDGDYIVHCLYSVDTAEILYLEDNIHSHIENDIENFYRGIEFCGYDDIEETRAYIIVDNGLSYNEEAIGLCLSEENYVEVA